MTIPGVDTEITLQRFDDQTYGEFLELLGVANDTTSTEPSDIALASDLDEPASGLDRTGDEYREPQSPGSEQPLAAAVAGEPASVGQAGSDSTTDADETAVSPEDELHPIVRVLGPVDIVRTRGHADSNRQPRLIELAAWLVLNPGHGPTEVTEAVWPEGCSTSNRNSTVSRLRAWLGKMPDNRFYVPDFKDGTPYHLRPEVGCDWLRFRHLLKRGIARGGAAGAGDLEQALRLVRGEPFTVTVRGRYAWAEPDRQEAISEIIDAADTLARHHLGTNDWDRARTAAEMGLLGAPGAEQLHRHRLIALAQLDDQEGLRAAIKELDAYNESNGMEMDAETLRLIDQLTSDRL